MLDIVVVWKHVLRYSFLFDPILENAAITDICTDISFFFSYDKSAKFDQLYSI